MKTRLLAAIAAGALCLAASGPSLAQDANWPVKPLRLLVGSARRRHRRHGARGGRQAGSRLGQTVVVENKPGASNTLAADLAAKSGDAHTMVMGVSTAHAIAPHLLKLGYDNDRDLTPVVFVGAVPNILVVNNQVPARTVQERSRCSRASRASTTSPAAAPAAPSTSRPSCSGRHRRADHAHSYRGSGPAMVDLMGGQVQIAFETASSVIPHIKSGKVRALAVLSAARNPQLPDVPTMAEAGVPGVEMSAWYGIYMPSGTPAAIQRRVHDEVNAILALSDTRARLQAIGADVSPMSQEQFARFHQAENQRYAAIIKKNHISVE